MTEIETHLSSCENNLSGHATTRAAQRGVADDVIGLVLTFGDLDYPAGARRRRLRLSRSRASELAAEGHPLRLIDGAQRVELILGAMDRVVTVLRCDAYPARRRTGFSIPTARPGFRQGRVRG